MLFGVDAEQRPVADTEGRGGPLADTVDGEERRTCERRRVERARGVALVMLGKDDRPVEVEFLRDQVRDPQLLLEPERHRLDERAEPARRGGDVRFEEAFEFEKRLVIKRHHIEIRRLDASLAQAVGDRVLGERGVSLVAREPLLLRRRDDAPVPHEAGGGVMIPARDPEDVQD